MIREDRKEMDLKDLTKLSEGIKLPSKNMEDMIAECQSKYQKRKILKKKVKITSICIASFIFCIYFGTYLGQPEISVYAATSTANVKLQENEQVVLSRQSTQMGVGYKLELALPRGEYTYTMTDENSQYPQNVFQKGNEIYWMPDGVGSNLRDADGNIIKLPKTDKTVINIQVMIEGTVKETFQLCLDKEDNICTVTLKEIDK